MMDCTLPVYQCRRRGATAVMALICMVMLLGFAALSVDVGMLYNNRSDLQKSADAAALSGAWELLDDDRLRGDAYQTQVFYNARTQVGNYAAENHVMSITPTVNASDVGIGQLTDPTSGSESMSYTDPDRFNSISVRLRRDETANGAIQLWFSQVFGKDSTTTAATATATFWEGITGFRVTDQTGNAELLPLALKKDVWDLLMTGVTTAGDNYTFNDDTETVTGGADGVLELNFYPGAGPTQLPPGNFGTVDIGDPGNSTADLARQIRHGVNAADLAFYGGAFELNDEGYIMLNGDTGLSAGIKDDLISIIGKPRAIPLFTTVTGPGNNAQFKVVGFAGIRIMDVKLTGAMALKYVIIQPAHVVDDSAIEGSNDVTRFVYAPPRLTR